tara:strand:- start:36 stop:296 length:261 start_codon:yes stop_codon:yes gene_type:complete
MARPRRCKEWNIPGKRKRDCGKHLRSVLHQNVYAWLATKPEFGWNKFRKKQEACVDFDPTTYVTTADGAPYIPTPEEAYVVCGYVE